MTSPFNDPGTGGDKLPLADLLGALLLFTVKEDIADIQTAYGPSNAIRCDVAVLDGPHKAELFGDTLVFPRVLQGQLRSNTGGGMVLGRLGQGTAKPGQSPAWVLSAATDADREIGTKYLAYVASRQPATVPVAEKAPF